MMRDTMGNADGRRTLLASIHDASPLFLGEAERLRAMLASHVGASRIAMLVIPDHWRQARIRSGTTFAAHLRQWADQGSEIFLHGWDHLDGGGRRSMAQGLKARMMTAREGEFLGVTHEEALRLLRDGRALVEDIIGRPVAGFIAPAWLYGEGARKAIAELEFPVCEDHLRVWEPATGQVLAKGPVVTWASRSWARAQSSLAFAACARTILPATRHVRIAVHPGDLSREELCRSIEATFARLVRSHAPGRYADLRPAAAMSSRTPQFQAP